MSDQTMSGAAQARGEALWAFMTRVYAQPGVQPACLTLQDGCDADIVLLLAWAAQLRPGQTPLGAGSIAGLQRHLEEWRRRCVLPLRALRIELREPGSLPGPEREALRAKIKALELGAERSQVAMIAAWLEDNPPEAGQNPEAGLALLLGRSGKVDPEIAGALSVVLQASLAG